MPARDEVLAFLDSLDFGPYVLHDNDCDCMAQKARDALSEKWPKLKHGILAMWGFTVLGRLLGRAGRGTLPIRFSGHGILVFKLPGEPKYYYDCTTSNGRDHRRQRSGCWGKMWAKYSGKAYWVFFWKHIWGDYTPMSLLEVRIVYSVSDSQT